MSSSKFPKSVWISNFYKGLSLMINEETNSGKTVTGIIMSHGIYSKLSDEMGYNPADILGYVIEVLDDNIEIEGAEEIVMLKGHTIN